MSSRRRRRAPLALRQAATSLLCLSAVLVSAPPAAGRTAVSPPLPAAPAPPAPAGMPEPPAAPVVREELAALTVAPPRSMSGYSRNRFPHWVTQHQQCDTREVVLARDGKDVVTDARCRASSGSWYSAYDGVTLAAASQVDIDHMVPLANAWRSGADGWDVAKRRTFANDLTNSQLIAVSAASNRAKGDQSPDQWKPRLTGYHCTYSRAWTHVKHLYGLSVTPQEKAELTKMLDTCA
ncbi:HNH endonuclease family protein [Streptomyces sp. URMC 123]|uniref:HNH endonuclease family protein n=1 Tax=Streptomyces sp. URMC 123 TaxID=3423403 RepID=UPI003F1C8D6A